MELKLEQEINEIRGKLKVNKASLSEIDSFLKYVSMIETLVEDASEMDFYGTEGYKY